MLFHLLASMKLTHGRTKLTNTEQLRLHLNFQLLLFSTSWTIPALLAPSRVLTTSTTRVKATVCCPPLCLPECTRSPFQAQDSAGSRAAAPHVLPPSWPIISCSSFLLAGQYLPTCTLKTTVCCPLLGLLGCTMTAFRAQDSAGS